MKRLLVALLALMLILSSFIRPHAGYADEQDDIDREINRIKQQEADLALKKSAADKQKADAKTQKVQEQRKLEDIQKDLAMQGNKLMDLSTKLDNATLKAKEAGFQLVQAEERVEQRDKLLKSRVKLMYMSGTVSYLDVIFSATSFSDFLDRYYVLKTIVGQDKNILTANQADRDTMKQKKSEVEAQLAQVRTYVAETEAIKQTLSAQERLKQTAIASLNKKEQDADHMSEEAEAAIVALARQKAELQKRKAELAAQSGGKQQPVFAYAGGKLAWPVPNVMRISSVFGMRLDPIRKIQKLHKGIDIAAPSGTAIVAAEEGIVLISGWVNGYGNTIVLDHGSGLWTWYAHIRDGGLKVGEGDIVKRGQKIAEVGTTGDSTGNHLHFEVRLDEVARDPLPYLK